MAAKKHIDKILKDWPFDSDHLSVRLVDGGDGREIIQMRIDMGLLQLETQGRPDGTRPFGNETVYHHLVSRQKSDDNEFVMDDEQCNEIDREFVQFYHRRICWLTLRKFDYAVRDADHTLALMDFCRAHSPDEEWTMSHEQYRPFVLFHRTQASALSAVEEENPEAAIQNINEGLDNFRTFFECYDAEDHFEEDELVKRLVELRESMREQFEVGKTLHEQLADAVAAEQYELAARLRDELAQRGDGGH